MTDYIYIVFIDISWAYPKRKTMAWSCINKRSGDELGQVKWYSSWRQYCFFPASETIFNIGCLRDVNDFIDKQMQERKERIAVYGERIMGMDINATLMVGLAASELEITEAPLYDNYMKEHGVKHKMDASWRELCGDFYFFNKEKVGELTAREIHLDNLDLFIGFVIADSGSWSIKKLDPLDTSDEISMAEDRFEKLFGKKPKLLLFPRMW